MEGIFPSNMGGNMNAVKEDVEKLVQKELESANQRFPMFRSDHEGAAVIFEEIQEAEQELKIAKSNFENLWNAVKRNESSNFLATYLLRLNGNAVRLACEAIQVAAMAQKFIDSQKVREKSEGN